MSRIKTLLALTLCVSTSLKGQETKPAPPTKGKVILEDSFEKGNRAPESWKIGASVQGVKYLYDKKRGSQGNRSLSLQKSAQRYFPIAQWYRTIPSPNVAAIDVRAKVKATKVTKAILEVQFLDANQRMITKKWLGYIGAKRAGDKPVTHTWKSYGDVAEVPSNTKQVLIALQIYGPGKVWFDELVVSETAVPAPEMKVVENATTLKINDADAQYIYKAPRKTGSKPLGLLVVLPGGDGSADFHPFVSRIHELAADDDVVLAQPIARKWSESQQIVWPTNKLGVRGMKFTTEELINAVVADVKKKHTLHPKRISVLAWSSSGPAVYAAMLQEKSVVSNALIAMSVFKPDYLPNLSVAKGRNFYLLHSQQDRTCPYWMAKQAEKQLRENKANVTFAEYQGGHGWHGDVFGNIRKGLQWLEREAKK